MFVKYSLNPHQRDNFFCPCFMFQTLHLVPAGTFHFAQTENNFLQHSLAAFIILHETLLFNEALLFITLRSSETLSCCAQTQAFVDMLECKISLFSSTNNTIDFRNR